jgi:hypothetical protein
MVSECDSCAFTLCLGYEALVCPYCLVPFQIKNNKFLFVFDRSEM